MRALRVHSYDSDNEIVVDDIPIPQPEGGEIRVRVQVCGISYVDLLLAKGHYQLRPPLPFIAGIEFSGVVDAIGPDTQTSLKPGDPVCGVRQGAWADFICVPANRVHALREGVNAAEAAVTTSAYSTALYALRERGSLRAGETLLVLGASGGVGHATVQLGRWMGARVVAGASTQVKRDAALAAGAHEAIDTSTDWKEVLKKSVAPHGVDVCFDPVGGAATETAFRTLGWEGRHLMIGFASGEIPSIRTNLPIVKGASLVGVDVRQFGEKRPEKAVALQRECVALLNEGAIRPSIRASLPIERFADAVEMASQRSACGRVVFTF